MICVYFFRSFETSEKKNEEEEEVGEEEKKRVWCVCVFIFNLSVRLIRGN